MTIAADEFEPPEVAVPTSAWQARTVTGQWTKARIVMAVPGGAEKELVRTLRVVAVKEEGPHRHVRVDVNVNYAGNRETTVERYVAREDVQLPAPAEEKNLGEQVLTVSGVKLVCRLTERTTSADPPVTIRTWNCDRVPLDAVVRIEHNGKAVFEVVDYGPK